MVPCFRSQKERKEGRMIPKGEDSNWFENKVLRDTFTGDFPLSLTICHCLRH